MKASEQKCFGAFELQERRKKVTVQKDVTKNIYIGNGATTTFPYTFECPSNHPEYIKVYLEKDDGSTVVTADFLLDMDNRRIIYPSNGTPLAAGRKIIIVRELPIQQLMNLVNNGPYFAEDVETSFDECVMMIQQLSENIQRSLKLSIGASNDVSTILPYGKDKAFAWSKDGKGLVLTENPANVIPIVDGKVLELQEYIQKQTKEIQELVESLNSLTREELISLRDQCKDYMEKAQGAALINVRWQIGNVRKRDPSKPTYGLDGNDLIINVPDVIKLTILGDSNV